MWDGGVGATVDVFISVQRQLLYVGQVRNVEGDLQRQKYGVNPEARLAIGVYACILDGQISYNFV